MQQNASRSHRNRSPNIIPHQPTILLHHARQKLSLRIQRTRTLENIKLEIMPPLRGPRLPRRVTKAHIIIHAQEIRNAIAILVLPLPERDDTMHNAR